MKFISEISRTKGQLALQRVLFERISQKILSPKKLPIEISETLGISMHSAYRRLRHDVQLSMGEMEILTQKYGIDANDGIAESPDTYSFTGHDLSKPDFDFIKSMKDYVEQYQERQQEEDSYMMYAGLDITPACLHSSPVILAFLEYFWKNCFQNNGIKQESLFSVDNIREEISIVADLYFDTHQYIRSTEIWNPLCLETILHQIEYMRDMQLFDTENDCDALYEELNSILDFKEHQARIGFKMDRQRNILNPTIAYELYNSDLFFADSAACLHTANCEMAILKHNYFFYMFTEHKPFVENTKKMLNTFLSKAKPITATNERGRTLFFNGLRERVRQSRIS